MASGTEVKTLDTLILYTMSKEVAEKVKDRFTEMGINGEDPSYLDCVIFDAALEVLGIEQAYYGISDSEWEDIVRQRKIGEKQFGSVRTIDITDTWNEIMTDVDEP